MKQIRQQHAEHVRSLPGEKLRLLAAVNRLRDFHERMARINGAMAACEAEIRSVA